MERLVLSDLLDLQEVDLEIDRLLDRRAGLPELETYRSLHEQRVAAEKELAELESRLRTLELELDKAEGELDIVEEKHREAETRLYAGGMSARETEHKRLEVRSLKGQIEALEERVLGLLDEKEQLDAQVGEARRRVAELLEQEREVEAAIAEEWRRIDAEVARREERKAEIVRQIPEDLLALYERLRRSKEGVAVGRLEDGQCGGCHLHLSRAEQLEAAESDPPRCVHCRRILVI
jgi:predicted  nucleic acid-binding Zn-ribbon protein